MSLLHWTRRGLLATTAALALGVMTLPALAQTPPGVLVVGQVAEPQALDPATVTAANDFRILVNVFEGLVGYAPGTFDIVPELAESWEVS